jgi:hypothetical protein
MRRSTPIRALTCGLALACALWPGAAVAGEPMVCGNGVVDPGEDCDDGPANSDTGCCSRRCSVVDWDFDGLCDALDPCFNYVSRFAERVRLLGRPGHDGTMRVRVEALASLTPGVPLDPVNHGARVLLARPPDEALVDAEIPPGDGWRGAGARWRWTARGKSSHGVDDLHIASVGDDHVRVTAILSVARDALTAPLRFGVRLDATAESDDDPSDEPELACVEARFPVIRCDASDEGTIRCREEPRFPVCRKPGLETRIECGVLRAAAAQERYYDVQRSHGPDCTELPGWWQPRGSVATCVGDVFEHLTLMATPYLPGFECCARATEHELVVECGADASCEL